MGSFSMKLCLFSQGNSYLWSCGPNVEISGLSVSARQIWSPAYHCIICRARDNNCLLYSEGNF